MLCKNVIWFNSFHVQESYNVKLWPWPWKRDLKRPLPYPRRFLCWRKKSMDPRVEANRHSEIFLSKILFLSTTQSYARYRYQSTRYRPYDCRKDLLDCAKSCDPLCWDKIWPKGHTLNKSAGLQDKATNTKSQTLTVTDKMSFSLFLYQVIPRAMVVYMMPFKSICKTKWSLGQTNFNTRVLIWTKLVEIWYKTDLYFERRCGCGIRGVRGHTIVLSVYTKHFF